MSMLVIKPIRFLEIWLSNSFHIEIIWIFPFQSWDLWPFFMRHTSRGTIVMHMVNAFIYLIKGSFLISTCNKHNIFPRLKKFFHQRTYRFSLNICVPKNPNLSNYLVSLLATHFWNLSILISKSQFSLLKGFATKFFFF
jgi:hypothetical protein